MNTTQPVKIALVWAQFAAYHIDRCEAVARRLGDRAEVRAIEVATTSVDYAWEPSGGVEGARKITLFPGQAYDAIPAWRRIAALFRGTRDCDWVMIGLSYGEGTTIALSWLLKLAGVRVVVFSESKYDDRPRSAWGERAKRLLLSCYAGAIVGARRHMAYLRSLGFDKRPVLPGYDSVGLDRVRAQSGGILAPEGVPFADREFLFVGRFVDKKNLPTLIEGYAEYVRRVGDSARRLVLAGSGDEEPEVRARIATHGLEQRVELTGFLAAPEVSRRLARALALVLVSQEEQWGLVVNEAIALGLPALVSEQVGSRDALVADGINGFVVNSASVSQIGAALERLAADEGQWRAMVAQSHQRAWMADTDRLADAVEVLVVSDARSARERIDAFVAAAG